MYGCAFSNDDMPIGTKLLRIMGREGEKTSIGNQDGQSRLNLPFVLLVRTTITTKERRGFTYKERRSCDKDDERPCRQKRMIALEKKDLKKGATV